MPSNSATDRESQAAREAIERFHEAVNRHNVEACVACVTDDVVFEATAPPDGTRYEGRAALRGFFEGFFRESPHAHFAVEDLFAAGDRGVVRWRYTWQDATGNRGHVRGVDVFRVRDGKVSEALAYVKG